MAKEAHLQERLDYQKMVALNADNGADNGGCPHYSNYYPRLKNTVMMVTR